MSDVKKPPAFYCPACGQKHRADLTSLRETTGAVMRLACVGCQIPLRVSLGEEGQPVCTREGAEAAPPAPPAAQAQAEASPTPPAQPAPTKKAPARRSRRRHGRGAADAQADAPPPDGNRPPAPPEAASPEGPPSPPAEPAEAGASAHAPVDGPGKPAAGKPDLEGEFEAGTELGRYTIERVIGKGGTSTVYAVFDPTTNRSVALKVLDQGQGETSRRRFLREIEVQANIRHQNIMPVFDRGTIGDARPYFTMELLYDPWSLAEIVQHREEGTLARYTTLRKLEDLETLIKEILVPVADGIYVANVENGVIHRDLKPDNVLVDSRTLRPYVIDFGICHVLERKAGFASKAVIPPTAEDEGIVGTPRFLAPEQVRGNVHARTDVWGLGATLHYIVTGEPPLAGSTPISSAELKRRIAALEETKQAAIAAAEEHKVELCDEKLARLTDPGLRTIDDLFKDARDARYSELPASTPAPLRAVIRKAMAATTAERYVNARQLSADLQAWLAHGRVRALTQAGGKAAAVESARRAVRTHTSTALWLVAGFLAGLGLAALLAKPGGAPPSTRLEDAKQDIQVLDDGLEALRTLASNLTAVERNRIWSQLDARAQQIDDRLAREPDVPQVRSVRERLGYVRSRFAPVRIRLDVAPGTSATGVDLVSQQPIRLEPGENRLPPGAYRVTLGGRVHFPIQVPMTVRTQQQAEGIHEEPALATYALPLAPDAIPKGWVLVLGGRVLARSLPFNPPSTAPTDVPAFLMSETEVTNTQYAQFLRTLPLEERKGMAPTVAFVPDHDQDGAPTVVPGRESAPVVGIRPEDARAYAAWRSAQTEARVRLPSEAEWVLAAGAGMGHSLPGGAAGHRTDADFASPLRAAGSHPKDVSEFGVHGMSGNAREMVQPEVDDQPPGAVLAKGAGVGDDPDQAAIYLHRVLEAGARHPTTGFRCVRELPDPTTLR